jgi:hypothetical protein
VFLVVSDRARSREHYIQPLDELGIAARSWEVSGLLDHDGAHAPEASREHRQGRATDVRQREWLSRRPKSRMLRAAQLFAITGRMRATPSRFSALSAASAWYAVVVGERVHGPGRGSAIYHYLALTATTLRNRDEAEARRRPAWVRPR